MKAVLGVVVALVISFSPAVVAQDLFKSLKDFGKAIEKTQKPPTAQDSPDKAKEAAPVKSSATTNNLRLCLDEICLGDGIDKLTQLQWVTLAEWNSLEGTRRNNVEKGLKEAIGTKKVEQEKKSEREMEKLERAESMDNQLKDRLGGRLVADAAVIASIGKSVINQSANHFDNDMLQLLMQIEALCFVNASDTGKSRFVGALKKDSPNKTMVLIEMLFDGAQPNPQRFAVTSISRVFDISTSDQGAMLGLKESIEAQYPGVKTVSSPFYKNGYSFLIGSLQSLLGKHAGGSLFRDKTIQAKSRPELLVAKGGYDGMGNVGEFWHIQPQIPAACKQNVRTD